MLIGGWLLAVLALAGPAWDRNDISAYQSVDALVIVLICLVR